MVKTEEIISTDIIKPSSPSPSKTLEISFLDQIGPPLYIPLVFFYQHNNSNPNFDHAKISQTLKLSLSKTLSRFYPLAGTLQHNSFIDCDDSGVDFIEARVHSPLSWFTDDPENEELRQLIPADSSAHTTATLLGVKLSFFDCGGFSVGVCCSHKVGDYASYVEFMNSWAAETRGEEKTLIPLPFFDLSLRFPPTASAVEHFSVTKEKISTKRLVFGRETLEKIRALSVCDEVKNPTRVEALTSFIWSIFIEATKEKRGPQSSRSYAALQAINLRPRSDPPIPDLTFGNCYVGKFAFTSSGEMSDLVSSLRAAVRSVDADYIKNVVSKGDDYLRIVDEANASFKNGTTELFNFSSWWRFPVYEADFGWGRPSWVCTVAQSYNNLVLLMSTPTGDGIEAWINMPHDFWDIFQTSYANVLT